jgi:hypothetical protein
MRLVNYSARLVEHAVLSLAKHRRATQPTSVELDFYLQGLDLCRRLSPEAVEAVGITMAEIIVRAFEPEDRNRVIEVLEAYYSDLKKLPAPFVEDAEFVQNAAIWAAVSDVHRYCTLFMTRANLADDGRDILMCVQRSLNDNGLVSTFNISQTTYQSTDGMNAVPQTEIRFPFRSEREEAAHLASRMPKVGGVD